jgi:hypothetical protein
LSAPQADALARELADTFEARGIPYAVGGSIALAAWGYARATVDVDLDVFAEPDALEPVFEALEAVGCVLDRAAATARAHERGDFRTSLRGMRVDVFVPSIPLYESARRRVRREVLLGRPAWFLAPEDLAIFKMLFFRGKDVLDVERLLAVRGPAFERDYVRQWLVDLLGEEDERVAKWDAMCATIARE